MRPPYLRLVIDNEVVEASHFDAEGWTKEFHPRAIQFADDLKRIRVLWKSGGESIIVVGEDNDLHLREVLPDE